MGEYTCICVFACVYVCAYVVCVVRMVCVVYTCVSQPAYPPKNSVCAYTHIQHYIPPIVTANVNSVQIGYISQPLHPSYIHVRIRPRTHTHLSAYAYIILPSICVYIILAIYNVLYMHDRGAEGFAL